jgi:flagellar basal body-associated protein FliL
VHTVGESKNGMELKGFIKVALVVLLVVFLAATAIMLFMGF